DLGLGPLQASAMQAAEIAMPLRVAEAALDHRAAQPIGLLGLIGLHPFLVGLDPFLPLQALDCPTLVRIADATLAQRATAPVLRRAAVRVLAHLVVVAPLPPLSALASQPMSLRAAVGLLLGEPLELLLVDPGPVRLGSLDFGEVVLSHRGDQLDL